MRNLSADKIKRLVALHGWSGTILAIFLYVVILTGSVVVFDNEIHEWSSGEATHAVPMSPGLGPRFAAALDQVDPAFHEEILISQRADGALWMRFEGHLDEDPSRHHGVILVQDPSGQILARREGVEGSAAYSDPTNALREFWVDLHVRLHLPQPWGLFATGILGLTMLVAAVTGVLIHRHVIRDLFVSERPGKRVVSLRDRHTLAGVWGLPFAIALAFTGAFLSFATSLGLPVVAMVAFGGDQQKAIEAVLGSPHAENAAPAPSIDLDLALAAASLRSGTPTQAVFIDHYGRADAVIRTIQSRAPGDLNTQSLEFDGESGAYLGQRQTVGTAPSLGTAAVDLMGPLHFGNFFGLFSRVIWVALGAAMTYSVVTGMQLWLRRRADAPGWARCEAALLAVAWGLPIAMAVSAYGFFMGLRFGAADSWTAWGFVLAALVALLWPLRRSDLLQLAAQYRLGLGALLGFLPIWRMGHGGTGWADALQSAAPAVMAGDLLCWMVALQLLWPALRASWGRLPASSPQ
ncbi:MAG: PepSY domain-containing protein [Mangrovicoccus sp.]|nr:PepSY domain-containing protein [Mangrovicoccus sp.]